LKSKKFHFFIELLDISPLIRQPLVKIMKGNVTHIAISILMLGFYSCTEDKYAEALSPEESIATFNIHENFEVKLFASEPHIKDPVNVVFDEKGIAYAVEMPDYPYKPEEGKGKGVIKRLEDTDGDGLVDASTVFAEGLADATNLMPWKGGLLVTAAPHIYYLKDTDNDGVADAKTSVFSGFFENNSEAQITNLRLGIDNWIYAANNGQRSDVTYKDAPEEGPLQLRGADFRFRLDKELFEKESGTAQFGQTFDDWGNKFFTQNTLHIQQTVIPNRYLERHGKLSNSSVNHNISDHELEMFQLTPPPYWRAERTRRRNIQYQEQELNRVEYAEDHFTGASGGTVYDGGNFPEGFNGNIFTGEVAGNLVHRDIIVEDKYSPTLVAKRASEEQDKEFLASTDPWFRPVGFTVGPDGALFMVDFYRQHIETPVSIPDDLKEDMDFMKGMDRGRIYRIVPKSGVSTMEVQDFTEMDPETLVSHLAHKNGWWRTTAQRIILENPKDEYIPLLKALASNEDPNAQLHALYLLQSMDALEVDLVKEAMQSNYYGIRKNALMLAEAYPELKEDIAAMINDESPIVSLQAILSLGNYEDDFTINQLAKALVEKGENKWFRLGILSSNAGSSEAILKVLDSKYKFSENEADWKKAYLNEVDHILVEKGIRTKSE
jgi:putative membrane-bound dehydrogenase-like protein